MDIKKIIGFSSIISDASYRYTALAQLVDMVKSAVPSYDIPPVFYVVSIVP
jgi:hypothetical protein